MKTVAKTLIKNNTNEWGHIVNGYLFTSDGVPSLMLNTASMDLILTQMANDEERENLTQNYRLVDVDISMPKQ